LNGFPTPRHAVLACAATLALLSACGGDGSVAIEDPNQVAELPAVPDGLAIDPSAECTPAGIGATVLTADAPVTILDVSTGTTGAGPADKPYCLVKVKVDPAVNIWVALPTAAWNGRFRSEGGGVYAGTVGVAADSIRQGFVGVQTDTGHAGSPLSGAFGMLSPGVANTQLQEDFAHRSEHLMAVVGKQLVKAYYGRDPVRSYWFGCSTGGRQGLMMAQRYPEDYDAILAGAPAIHWDRFQAYQIWPQVAMREENGGPVAAAKLTLTTQRAVASCDGADGVTDGLIDDPRNCRYNPTTDASVTTPTCTPGDTTCLTAGEARAIQAIWNGARNTRGELLWHGLERGTALNALAGTNPFPIPIEQARYWVYLDPTWDWTTLNYANYEAFFAKNVEMVGPTMGTDNPDLSAFRKRGGKVIMYHGWIDPLIMPGGTVRYWDNVVQTMDAKKVPLDFAKLYMVPGMGHCSGGAGPNQFGQSASGNVPAEPKRDIFRALMDWSENGNEPAEIVATKFSNDNPTLGVIRTRPLCVYPQVARYKGSGSVDDAANFVCTNP
jgi:pimeloyl-ACP methyl ester carboxylesterase